MYYIVPTRMSLNDIKSTDNVIRTLRNITKNLFYFRDLNKLQNTDK